MLETLAILHWLFAIVTRVSHVPKKKNSTRFVERAFKKKKLKKLQKKKWLRVRGPLVGLLHLWCW